MADHEPDLAMYFVDAFVNIVLTAGGKSLQPTIHHTIMSRFAERIAIIVKGAQRLRKAISEEMTSCDLEVLYFVQDTVFDPLVMDDALSSDPPQTQEKSETVMCTTDLGLARVERKHGKPGEWDEKVLQKPKIVLRSGIDEMRTVKGGE